MKANRKTLHFLYHAYKDAMAGRRVLLVAHTPDHAESLARRIRIRIMMQRGNPALVQSSGRLIPKKIPLETAIHIDRNVIEVGIQGERERYGPRRFLLLWESFRKKSVDKNPDGVCTKDDKANTPRAEETEADYKGDD